MERAAACLQSCRKLAQARHITQLVVTHRIADPHQLLADDPTGSDGEVAHLGIAHLSVGQSNE